MSRDMQSIDMADESERVLLRVLSRKIVSCRMHHVLAHLAINGPPKRDLLFHLTGTSYNADVATRQPFMRGVILTPSLRVIVSFSHTPRLVDPVFLGCVIQQTQEEGDGNVGKLSITPAVNGRLIRLYCSCESGPWNFATNRVICTLSMPLVKSFVRAIEMQTCRKFANWMASLDKNRVWFFMIARGGNPRVFFVGSVAVLNATACPDSLCDWKIDGETELVTQSNALDISPLPALQTLLNVNGFSDTMCGIEAWMSGRLDVDSLEYTDQFNGIIVTNRETLVSVRIIDPLVFLLGRLVEGRERDPRVTIVRLFMIHYVVGANSCMNAPYQTHLAFAIHAALAALSVLFPAEYVACAKGVFCESVARNVPKSEMHFGQLVQHIVGNL